MNQDPFGSRGADFDGGELHLRDYLSILLRYRLRMVFTFFVVTAAVISYGMVSPPQYVALAKVAISRTETIDFTEQIKRSGMLGVDQYHLLTQMELLKSGPIFRETIRRLDLKGEPLLLPNPVTRWSGVLKRYLTGRSTSEPQVYTDAALTHQLRSAVTVRNLKGTDIITIQAKAKDRGLASRVVNTLAQVFAEKSLELKKERHTVERKYTEEKLNTTKEDLIDADAELRKFEEEKDTISLQKRIEHLTTLRIEGTGELADIERKIKELTARIRPLLNQISSARKGVVKATAESYKELENRIQDLKVQRASLLNVYTPEHPQIRSIEEQLAILEPKAAATRTALLEGKTGSVQTMNTAIAQHNDLLQDMEVLRAREASLRQRLKHYQAQLKSDLTLKAQWDFLSREVEANRKIYDFLLIRQKEAALTEAMQISSVKLIEPSRGAFAAGSGRSRYVMVGVAGGFILAFLVGLFSSYMDTTVHDARSMERQLAVPCLAQLPSRQGLPVDQKRREIDLVGDGPFAEPITLLGLSAELGTPDDPATVYLVTSGSPGDGKTTVAGNLAANYAQGGDETLLLDCDMRRPKMAASLGLPEREEGMRELLRLLEDPATADQFRLRELPLLSVVAPHFSETAPARLLAQPPFARLLMKLRSRFRRIIIDSPPVNIVSDALHLAPLSDRVVLVVRAEKSTIPEVELALRSIREVRGRPAGFVLNGLTPRGLGGYYGYGYGYGYGQGYDYSDSPRPKKSAEPEA